jgi:hypothetical protein
MKKERKGTRGIATRSAKRACSFSISIGSAPLATSCIQEMQQNAMQYRE